MIIFFGQVYFTNFMIAVTHCKSIRSIYALNYAHLKNGMFDLSILEV